MNIFNLISNKNITKIAVIHDYYLFYPNIPNPVKSDNRQPSIENIEQANCILSNCSKVIFNSSNCYNNYCKYINLINNSLVLNNVPDIDFYAKRCFPNRKNKYNIGIIGNVANCVHKGKYLLEKIVLSYYNNSKYNFVAFGESTLNEYNNLIVTGKYNNNDIFNLINNYDIDYFLFLSTFEETYSLALTIAIKTGLPIIYNNIGSYTERLNSYHNCFSFTEDNFMEIHSIIKEIENNLTENNSNKVVYNIELYNNIPELSDYLKNDDDLNFDLSVIKNNLNYNNICFIHLINNNNIDNINYENILADKINYIKTSGLYEKLDYIFISIVGKYIKIINDYKIKLIYYSSENNEMELPTIERIKYFCDNINVNVNILYLNTLEEGKKSYSFEWIKYLEYFLIEKHDLCLKALDNYHCVGLDQYFNFNDNNEYKSNFSGNCWWCQSKHIKKLPIPIQTIENKNSINEWIIGNLFQNDYRNFLSLHHTHTIDNFNEKNILPCDYKFDVIKNEIMDQFKKPFIKKRCIYGIYFICCKGNYFDILRDQLKTLMKSGLYNETDKLLCFVCNQREECLSLLKKYSKIKIISSHENLYEKFAINNFKKYLSGKYFIYYIHTKGVTRCEKWYYDWRKLCDYFTINKWRLNVELLNYYDCVGINLKNFPKKHFSGNFWWSKSEHVNKLNNINDGYLSCEMYVLSYIKTNYISIHEKFKLFNEHPPHLYVNTSDEELLNNINKIPDFNTWDKNCINKCGDINLLTEPPILEIC